MTTTLELRNIIAILRSIDRHEIEAEAGPITEKAWSYFWNDPYRGFLSFGGHLQSAIARIVSARMAGGEGVVGWQSMETAPLDGKHCILAIKTGAFVYSIQGAFMKGKWMNAADIDSEPLAWMPNVLLPDEFCPWTDQYKARAALSTATPPVSAREGVETGADIRVPVGWKLVPAEPTDSGSTMGDAYLAGYEDGLALATASEVEG